jgi:prevent-host-death family protein
MFKVKPDDEVTIVGVSELRSKINEVLEKVKREKILLTRRNKPEAVLINFEKFQQLEQQLEALEDEYFGRLALQRLKEHKKGKRRTLSHSEMMKKYGA